MPISDEELIAYLLGDATPQQRKRVELGLAEDEEIRARVAELRFVLGQLDSLHSEYQIYQPPADLLETTMARIDEVSRESEAEAEVDSESSSDSSRRVELAKELSQVAEVRVRRGTWDSTALALCLTLLFCLFLPTVLGARFESRKAQCAYLLGSAGRGLLEFASLSPQHRFPAVELDGPRSFTGIYAIRLRDLGYVVTPSQLWCPSLEPCRPVRGQLVTIPSLAQLDSFDTPQLELCHNEAGGDFAYPLGVLEGDAIVAPRCEGRSHFPILSDVPGFQSGRDDLLPHDGRGLNLFFEDGHVEFVTGFSLENNVRDNPFCNLREEHEVGLNAQDASLGPSHFGPFGNK